MNKINEQPNKNLALQLKMPTQLKAIYIARHFTGREHIFESHSERIFKKFEKAVAKLTSGKTQPVERIAASDFKPERIRDKPVLPFVLYGLNEKAPIPLDYLTKHCGETMVCTHLRAVKGREWHDERLVDMPVREVLKIMERGDKINVSGSSQLFLDHPELLSMIKCKEMEKLFQAKLFREELFIGAKGSSSAFHCAGGGNIFVMAYGSKRWVLIDPQYTLAMYPLIGFNPGGAVIGSPVSSEIQAGQHRFPLYEKIPKYEAILAPGEILFNPPWWWHEVTNLSMAIGCPLRTMAGGANNHFFNALSALSPFGLKYMIRAGANAFLLKRKKRWLMRDDMLHDTFPGRSTSSQKIRDSSRSRS